MTTQPDNFNPNIAHFTTAGGSAVQVLNEAGDDWDETATAAAYAAHEAAQLKKKGNRQQ